MVQTLVCLLMLAAPALPQAEKTQIDLFKKEARPLQAAVDEAVNAAASVIVIQHAKATYLEGYGVVVTIEAVLVPPRNPFDTSTVGSTVRTLVVQRKAQVQQKLEELLKQQTTMLNSIRTDQSLAIILYLVNSNPADVPNLPEQIVLTAKKQDPTVVTVREF